MLCLVKITEPVRTIRTFVKTLKLLELTKTVDWSFRNEPIF